jgi:hypothetical protein
MEGQYEHRHRVGPMDLDLARALVVDVEDHPGASRHGERPVDLAA